MDTKKGQVNQKTRFLALSLKKNKIHKEKKLEKLNHSSDVIIIDESFERLRSDFPKHCVPPQKIYSPIILEESNEVTNDELLLNTVNNTSKSGKVSLDLSACSLTHNTSHPSCNGWSPAQDFFCARPRGQPEPSTPSDILNESQEHCSMEKITKSHHKLLSELYGDDIIWNNFRTPNGVSKKLLYEDEDKENIRSVIKKNKELYLTDSERKKKSDTENSEIKSRKKLYTEMVSTPEVPKVKIPCDVKTTVKKNSKAMTVTELVEIMDDVLKEKDTKNTKNKLKDEDSTRGYNIKDKKVSELIDARLNKVKKNISEKANSLTVRHNQTSKKENVDIIKKKGNISVLTNKLKLLDVCHTPETKRLSFVASLADNVPSWRCHPEALQYHDKYKTLREQLVRRLYSEFNREVFGNKLDKDMPLIWDTKLRSTAGTTTNRLIKKSTGEKLRVSSVKLSTKVLDSAQRARDTLIHEMCHAATWILDGELKAGHGPLWVKWCKVALRVFPELEEISRCHELEIHYKYSYKCKQCGYSIKRHSKSIDVTKKCCGYCRGTFEVIVNKKNKDGVVVSTPARSGNTNEFALYVKENYGSVKKSGQTHAQVMKLLGEQFSVKKKSKESVE
ncbi:uncharacterized protein LOC110999599 isoform X1 [Pieris rapae]|uniref:uncharacterized protein LOC110999599 isoform X1 n=1 Tax=Pieris rapae TaxID=64459 RepID=UPI001E27B408|nr:uncharacterized protein LOC110999599 isoform X1 [Pieris rapae]